MIVWYLELTLQSQSKGEDNVLSWSWKFLKITFL